MLKKPSILLASYNNLQSIYCPHTGLPIPSFPTFLPQHGESSRRTTKLRRNYATLQPDKDTVDDEFSWPSVSSSAVPSPYQIFHISPRDAYTKHRFYELVKIYHPDRDGHTCAHAHIHSLPGAVKMERYRLIVAANDILSDPIKRKAYDRTGAGWNGRMEHSLHPSQYNWSNTGGNARWSGFDTNDSPFHNATWEDWERWYNRHHRKQEPIYISNGGFLSLVIVAVALGAAGQNGQISRHEALFKKQVEVKHEEATKMMTKHRQQSQNATDMDQRVQKFLRERDIGAPIRIGDTTAGDSGTRLLPEPVVCMSDTQHKRSGGGKPLSNDR